MVVDADAVAPWWAGRQRILNARAVPAKYAEAAEPIAVTARLVWSDDGVEFTETVAMAWTVPLVLVTLRDARSRTRGVWLPASDVRRR